MKEISIIQLTLPDGRLVMQRRDNNTKISPGLLGYFGGHVEMGESADIAMKRELAEETSLDVESLDIGYVATSEKEYLNGSEKVRVKMHLYKTEIQHDDFDVYDGEGFEAYTLTELKNRPDLAPTARYIIDRATQ